jgi:hypothetical protein
MLKHVVTWNVKDKSQKAQSCAQAKAALEGLRGKIPGLLAIECGQHAGEESPAAADFILYSEFTDAAALGVYAVHPLHLVAKEVVAAVMTERRVVDWDSPG